MCTESNRKRTQLRIARHPRTPPAPCSFEQTLGDASTLSEGGAPRLAAEATERDKVRPTTGQFRQGRKSARLGALLRAIETARCAAPSGASVSAAISIRRRSRIPLSRLDACEGRADADEQVILVEWLAQVADNPISQRARPNAVVRVSRDQNGRNGLACCL